MKQIVPQEIIEKRIFMIRGCKIMLSLHLSELYGVETRVLNQAVKRNSSRFPNDFMFQLTTDEAGWLVSQNVIPQDKPKRPIACLPQAGISSERTKSEVQS